MSGILVAGNMIVDVIKDVDVYPQIGMLANIRKVKKAIGGCAPNTAIDLSVIDPTIPVSVAGRVGADEYGEYILKQLQLRQINTDRVCITHTVSTSFSDVMSLTNGERTFFHAGGANALFCPEDVDISELDCDILHIGYILLLDIFDQCDPTYGTRMARFLHHVQQTGIKTSIDVVSNSTADYPTKIIPALKYCDYVIINEIECCSIWGIKAREDDGRLNIDALREAMMRTMGSGVRDKVIVHSKEAGFCLAQNGEFTMVPSRQIPTERIKGSVGAGDAFCAGCLYSLYTGKSDQDMLEFASAAAACSLFSESAVDGMQSKSEILKLLKTYPSRTLTL